MSDILGYLNGVLHRVSATFMPTEMDDVASFLRGDAWLVSTAASSTESRDKSLGAAMSTTVRYPLGATRWGHFIPLGIAGTALVSAATSSSRAVLLNFFAGNGFKQVLTVSLVPTEQQQHQQSQLHLATPGMTAGSGTSEDTAVSRDDYCSGSFSRAQRSSFSTSIDASSAPVSRKRARSDPTSSAAVDVSLDSRYSITAEAARHNCMAAVRRWFEKVEEKAFLDLNRERQNNDKGALAVTTGDEPGKHKTQLQRLLLIVRCCTDNRVAFSTRGCGIPGGQASCFGAGRRHRHGEDPLYLLLHELAALTILYEVRLAATCCAARPAVLLLPEDDGYGGTMLRQQLRDEVGYRFWVELFQQSEGASSGGTGAAEAGRGSPRGDGWRTTLIGSSSNATDVCGGPSGISQRRRPEQAETPLARGCRLAAQWGVLHLPETISSEQHTTPSEVETSSPANLFPSMAVRSGGDGCFKEVSSSIVGCPRAVRRLSAQQQEEELRRHAACFFVRPSNAPLCVFLMEALRRFPVLVCPVVLRHWQTSWTARHSLTDSLFAFHTALCPFVLSSSYAGYAGASQASPALSGVGDGSPFLASRMLQDTTDLLDALLRTAFTLAEERDTAHPLSVNDFAIEQATLFLLFYEALVHQREGQLRRIPDIVRVLVALSDRYATAAGEAATGAPSRGATTDEKVHYAVHHLLPFAPLNLFYERVAQFTAASPERRDSVREVQPYPMNSLVLPIRRMSFAHQLQHSTLLALLPIGESLMELQGVAERVWRDELPSCWRRAVAATCTEDHPAGVPSSSAEQRRVDEDSGNRTPAQLSPDNFYHPQVPHAVRVLYVLTAHALRAPTEAAKQVPIVHLQIICQLSDEQLLRVLKELQSAGLASANLKTKMVRTLLDTV
ncbi:hypothetical protein JKF63_07465 [Porcisia hertigi]|uniref:Uncharacterized protein n=1 Tax=Porcisia hertigi TaxID=2761500 RepID=A0A836IPZ7_9TRYP|nr:hypothetical protein JKF63_07465 [Porcisia hertigi]